MATMNAAEWRAFLMEGTRTAKLSTISPLERVVAERDVAS